MRYYRPGAPRPATIAESLRTEGGDDLRKMLRTFCEGKVPTRKEEMVLRLLDLLAGENLRANLVETGRIRQGSGDRGGLV